jgi:hypothetical protein
MAFRFHQNPCATGKKEIPGWSKKRNLGSRDSRAVCFTCHKFKTIADEIRVEGETHPLCAVCATTKEEIKTRVCNKCEKEFTSINGLRTCFHCKGKHHKARSIEKLVPPNKEKIDGSHNPINSCADH